MKKTVIILSAIALIAGSCNQATKKQAETTNNEEIVSEQGEQSDEVELDTLVIPQSPENSDIKTDVQILLPAGYRGTEIADFKPMLSEEWYDFYQDSITKKHFLKKATIKIGKIYDDCLEDFTTYVGSQRNPLILVKGIIPQNKEISSISVKKRRIWPDEKYSFSFNGKTYLLRGDGNIIKSGTTDMDGGLERWDEVKNYKLYLSEQGKPEQLIIAIPTFNDTFVQILWIGDIDGDGKPDFIIDNSRNYEEKNVLLFLSSKAGEGEIVKIAASSSYQFDC
ncbi:MAG: hypothetical protein FWD60_03790 [Candidatus Azobacteroides sp.]|nr:hypothetical protein [Candidatus Azobacteroides sp.]